jgi:class 3 adenylate cyclase
MQQIADWLEKLGMSEYAQRFAENKIDVSVLPHLTDQDLKDIGVPLGHRRKMLAAISEVAAATATEPKVVEPEPKPQDTAERRQVTVMFSDLVGSTALSARMDPEDLREIISSYQKCVAETVRRFGGFIAKYMGDGVLVYFGYPQAHEDDAERAVRAALELIGAVSALKSNAPLQTRVGIATGIVVVGDLIGSGAAQEQAVVGETPNLAARLQGIAEPNMVVIAESTRKLLGNLFELEDLGAKEVKGAEPVRAWAALRASSFESRFDALHGIGLTALVGREEELELLLRRWSKAKTSEGQVVLLSGEAGIGKSRLTASLMERLVSEPHTRLRYFQFFCFWRKSAGMAAHGNAPFANDWQWLIGYPAVAAFLWLVGFFYGVFSGWATGAIAGLVVAALAFLITWGAVFVSRLLNAPVLLIRSEQERASAAEAELTERLAHKISVSLVHDHDGVRIVQTLVDLPPPAGQQRGPDQKWVQIVVMSATDLPLVDCETRLISAERISEEGTAAAVILDEPVICPWNNMQPNENRCMTIPAHVPQAANIFSVQQGFNTLYVETTPIKYGFTDQIRQPGKYRLKIGVSAQACPTNVQNFLFRWNGSYDNISITAE